MGMHDGRAAIVTGAAQGIGLAVAMRLVAEGARVVMADVQADKVDAAAKRVAASRNSASAAVVDVASADSVAAMVKSAVDWLGKLDILINVAGGSGHQQVHGIDDMTEEVWDRVIGTNLKGTFLCCRAAVAHLRKIDGGGRILNFATGSLRGAVGGASTMTAQLAYVAAKAGIVGFTNQLASELAADNVGVNAIQPGFTLTEPGARIHDKFHAMAEADQKAMLSRMRRPPRRPEEIAWACSAIVARNAAELSGAVVRLDGDILDREVRIVAEADSPLGRGYRLEAV